MKVNFIKLSLFIVFAFFLSTPLKAQDNPVNTSINGIESTPSKIKLNIGSDITSRYIWRGSDYGHSPCIQPTLSLSASNFEVGCWGSIATHSFYKEIDIYAKYTWKNISVIFTDYYIPSINGTPSSPDIRYFNYNDKETAHTFEGSLLYKGGDKVPLWLLGGVFIYGNDKRWGYDTVKDTAGKVYYSSYFEAGYTLTIQENSADLFLGYTPAAGAYGHAPGVINLGATGYRKIKISDKFELPVKASLIFNPQASDVFFVFGITL